MKMIIVVAGRSKDGDRESRQQHHETAVVADEGVRLQEMIGRCRGLD